MNFKHYDEQCLSPFNISREAEFAAVLIERWGMVAAVQDGEDSAGRHKIRLQTPEELIERAFVTSKLFHARATAEGWLKDLGPLAERQLLQSSYDGFRIVGVKGPDQLAAVAALAEAQIEERRKTREAARQNKES